MLTPSTGSFIISGGAGAGSGFAAPRFLARESRIARIICKSSSGALIAVTASILPGLVSKHASVTVSFCAILGFHVAGARSSLDTMLYPFPCI